MIRAVRVELLRLRSRRAVLLLVVIGIVGVLLTLGFAIGNAVPPSAAERAAATQQAADSLAQQQADPGTQRFLEDCRAAVAAGDTESYGTECEIQIPQAEWFLGWSPPTFVGSFQTQLFILAAILGLSLAVAGVTFAGAEWSAGTIGTQLLHEPRRGVVWSGKLAALLLVALVLAVLGVALTWAITYWYSARWGSTALVTPDRVTGEPVTLAASSLVWQAVRVVALIVGATAGGYGLAMLLRSSLGALGLVAGYAIAGEAVLRATFQDVQPYLLSARVAAFLDGEYIYYRAPEVCSPTSCDSIATRITALQGGVVLAILLALVLALSVLLFRRRDVA